MIFLLALLLLLASPSLGLAFQQCFPSTTCTIGEFLYDDEYQPQTGAVCTLTVKYPDGGDWLEASASATTDAWYYYDAAIGTTEGRYPANLCCSINDDYLCLDKSFEVAAPAETSNLTAADVWSYSSRSLTGFGSLVTDIWNHSTRSLTSFGDLIANIWSSSTTSTTSGPAQQIASIETEQQQQRVLLEKLVNAPIVSLSLEEGQTLPDLNSKLEQSERHAAALQELISQARQTLIAETDNQALTKLMALFDRPAALSALTAAWQGPAFSRLELDFTAVRSALLSANARPAGLTGVMAKILELGDTLDAVDGYLAQVRARAETLAAEEQKLAALLENWSGQGEAVLAKNVSAGRRRVLALNQFPAGDDLIESAKLKNVVFNLQALLALNRQLLAVKPGEPVRALWLTEGSVIFRGVITNPSKIISQTVPLKFYLPRELKTEDILSLDPSLTANYDTAEEALYVTGSYTLKPEEVRLIAVEVEDIWQLTAEELELLRKQAAELARPLEKTSFFAQGTVLKTEIEMSLGKILMNQQKAVSPENRIRAYREAKLELNGINANLAKLQDLASQAANTGSVFGFVGGVQAVAVWGILLIVIASFVFLTIYMRQLKLRPAVKPAKIKAEPAPDISRQGVNPLFLPAVAVVTAIVTVIISQFWLRPQPAAILEVAAPSPPASPKPSGEGGKPAEVNVRQEKQVLGDSMPKLLTVPEGSSVNIRAKPEAAAPIIMTVKTSLEVFVFDQKDGWSRFGFSPQDPSQSWWVSSQFLD